MPKMKETCNVVSERASQRTRIGQLRHIVFSRLGYSSRAIYETLLFRIYHRQRFTFRSSAPFSCPILICSLLNRPFIIFSYVLGP
jgi:hypothetical protein